MSDPKTMRLDPVTRDIVNQQLRADRRRFQLDPSRILLKRPLKAHEREAINWPDNWKTGNCSVILLKQGDELHGFLFPDSLLPGLEEEDWGDTDKSLIVVLEMLNEVLVANGREPYPYTTQDLLRIKQEHVRRRRMN